MAARKHFLSVVDIVTLLGVSEQGVRLARDSEFLKLVRAEVGGRLWESSAHPDLASKDIEIAVLRRSWPAASRFLPREWWDRSW